MNLDVMTAGIHIGTSYDISNGIGARLLSKAMQSSIVEANFIHDMLPKAGPTEIGGLLDILA